MKKLLLFLTIFTTVNCAFAQLNTNGDGYYRVLNKATGRYIRVIDNKADVNVTATNIDLGALETIRYFAKPLTFPYAL